MSTRTCFVRAIGWQTAGRSSEVVLALADAAGGTLDPAFDAHVLPVNARAMAVMQGRQSLGKMAARQDCKDGWETARGEEKELPGVLKKFKQHPMASTELLTALRELQGAHMLCHCSPKERCHG